MPLSRKYSPMVQPVNGARNCIGAGSDVAIDAKVDPAILGGLIVKVGSRMMDNSLRTKLNSLKAAMKGTQ